MLRKCGKTRSNVISESLDSRSAFSTPRFTTTTNETSG